MFDSLSLLSEFLHKFTKEVDSVFNKKGSVTIFLSLILAVVIFFTGVFVDYSRIKTAESLALQACRLAAHSVLASYSKDLNDKFGLKSLYDKQSNLTADYIAYHVIKDNLVVNGNNFWDLFGFEIDSVNIIPFANLANPDVTKMQIIDFMKYRAPAEALETILDKLKFISQIGNKIEGMTHKISMEKKVYRIEENLFLLNDTTKKLACLDSNLGNNPSEIYKKLLDTHISLLKFIEYTEKLRVLRISIENELQLINKAISDTILDIAQDENGEIMWNNSLINEYGTGQLVSYIDRMNELLCNFTVFGVFVPLITDPDFNTGMKEDIPWYGHNVLTDIDNNIAIINDNYSKQLYILDELKTELIDWLSESEQLTAYALKLCNDISNSSDDIMNQAEKGFELFNDDDTIIAQKMRLEFEKMLMTIGTSAMDRLGSTLHENLGVLKSITDSVICIPEKLETFYKESDDTSDVYKYSELLKNSFNQYISEYSKDIIFDYSRNTNYTEDSSRDPRRTVEKDISEVVNNDDVKDYVTIDNILIKSLPSQIKSIIGDDFLNSITNDLDFSTDNTFGTAEKGLEAAKNKFSNLNDILKNTALNVIEEIFVTEYILGAMKNVVTGNESIYQSTDNNMTAKNNFFDIRGNLLHESNSFFREGEVEYILIGNKSEKVNITGVKGEILAIRFAMNLLGAYMDHEKSLLANSIALAVAGWTVVGVPLIKTLIMVAWALAESVTDVIKLSNGELVPFYKTDFYLDLNLSDIGKTVENIVEDAVKITLSTVEGAAMDKVANFLLTAAENVVDEFLLEKGFYYVSDNLYDKLSLNNIDSANSDLNHNGDLKTQPDGNDNDILQYIKNIIYEWLYVNYNSQIESVSEKIAQTGNELKAVIMNELTEQMDSSNPTGLYAKINAYLEGINVNLAQYMSSAVGSVFSIFQPLDICTDLSSADSTNILYMSYIDYLRILLLLQNSDKKIYRMEDIIQLNMRIIDPDFTMTKQNTCVIIEAVVSIDYLFESQAFIDRINTYSDEKKRYQIKIRIYEGY